MLRRALLAAITSAAFVPWAFIPAASAASVEYTARLSARSEVPKTDSKGTGHLRATYDTESHAFNYTLAFENLSGPATAAHIHGPATRSQTAGVLAPLGDKNPTSPLSGTLTLTPEQAKDLESNRLYVNVHTAANPGGEIRGHIIHAHARRHAARHTQATTTPATGTPSTAAPAANPSPAASTPAPR